MENASFAERLAQARSDTAADRSTTSGPEVLSAAEQRADRREPSAARDADRRPPNGSGRDDTTSASTARGEASADARAAQVQGADERAADTEPDEDTSGAVDEDDVLVEAAPIVLLAPIDERPVAGAPSLALQASAAPAGAFAARADAAQVHGEADGSLPDPGADDATALLGDATVGEAAGGGHEAPTDGGGGPFESALVADVAAERRPDGASSFATVVSATRVEAQSSAAPAAPLDAAALAASNERAARVLDQIRVFVKPGLRSASLELTPANLGRIDVQLTFERGSVRAHLVVDAIDTYDALQRHMPELRASLERSGLEVGDLDLSFAARDQSAPRDGRGANGERTNTGSHATASTNRSHEGRGVETVWLRPSTLTSERVDTLA